MYFESIRRCYFQNSLVEDVKPFTQLSPVDVSELWAFHCLNDNCNVILYHHQRNITPYEKLLTSKYKVSGVWGRLFVLFDGYFVFI